MLVGVVDYEKQKDVRWSYDNGNSMAYYAIKSDKYPSRVTQGNGFKQGDIVEVDVNRSTTTVKYIVNGKVEATDAHSMLGDSSRVFYPFIEMFNKDDEVEWCPVDTSHK